MKKIVRILPVIMMIAAFSCIVDDITVKTDSIAIENPAGSATIKIGETLNATVTIAPVNATDQTFTLKSSDGTVATVVKKNSDQCCGVYDITITAAGAGTCNISAETANGKTHSIVVTVQPNVTRVTVTADNAERNYWLDEPAEFTFTVNPPLAPGDAFTGKLSREAGTAVGKYDITQGSLSAGTHYEITFVKGEFEIYYFRGEGTSGNPYKIFSPKQLRGWADDFVNKSVAPYANAGVYFQLTEDMDLSAYKEGEGWMPIGIDPTNPFKGNFDGNGKIVKNLSINRPAGTYQGLFGCIAVGGMVKSLALIADNLTSNGYPGGLAGYNFGAIENCNATITGNFNSNTTIGGLVGRSDGSVKSCYVILTGNIIGSINNNGNVGGVVGTSNGTVENCYVIGTGTVSSSNNTDILMTGVGGVVGNVMGGTLRYSYAAVNVSGVVNVGGVVGRMSGSGRTENCVALNSRIERTSGTSTTFGRVSGTTGSIANNVAWDGIKVNGTTVTGGTATNTHGADMEKADAKLQATYEALGWKFGTTDAAPWQMGTGNYKLPIFYWQTTDSAPMPDHLE